MKSYTGPLIIIAAALTWIGSGLFMSSNRLMADDFAIWGSIASGGLLVWGIVLTARGR
jgi:hypothetical protein